MSIVLIVCGKIREIYLNGVNFIKHDLSCIGNWMRVDFNRRFLNILRKIYESIVKIN